MFIAQLIDSDFGVCAQGMSGESPEKSLMSLWACLIGDEENDKFFGQCMYGYLPLTKEEFVEDYGGDTISDFLNYQETEKWQSIAVIEYSGVDIDTYDVRELVSNITSVLDFNFDISKDKTFYF